MHTVGTGRRGTVHSERVQLLRMLCLIFICSDTDLKRWRWVLLLRYALKKLSNPRRSDIKIVRGNVLLLGGDRISNNHRSMY